jgi:hypothetical protein
MIKDSIFIPIAACEERFIEQTIKSALHNAENPKNVYFGVFNNILKSEHSLLDNDFIVNNSQILYTEIISPAPLGIGFARMNASLLQFNKFEYSFQIDAHTLFTKKWDTELIKIFNKIKDENNIDEDKLVLSGSTGLSWSYNENNLNEIFAIKNGTSFFKIDPFNLEETCMEQISYGLATNDFIYDGKQGNLLSEKNINFPVVYGGKHFYDAEYKEVNCVHGTFMFSKANLNREVLHDPEDYFDGDQTNYSIRLLSRGYRIFTPRSPVIAPLNKYNEEKDNDTSTFSLFDTDHNWRTFPPGRNGALYQLNKNSDDRLFFNQIITGEYFGYWGTPDQESLDKVKKTINYPEENN